MNTSLVTRFSRWCGRSNQRLKGPLRIAILTAILAAIPFLTSGCLLIAAGAAGAGTVAYVQGDVEATLDASLKTSVAAAKSAIDHLEFHKISEEVDGLSAKFKIRTVDDKRVQIVLQELTSTSTDIKIRVSVFGRQQLSQRILGTIEDQLGKVKELAAKPSEVKES